MKYLSPEIEVMETENDSVLCDSISNIGGTIFWFEIEFGLDEME